ncbi:hypothetical protein VC83_07546 [Pseudogymnoascus destructans]|uniref:Uncharacterized protein n=2 Tax=Pseudogymnoascus destructans TaxID=655981 RepID=L8G2S0_PSED2|nr:uncharacterized protein VC83_07546 [Pseudogymnoascus destructans]ELR07432.1 hypothetical protein GMDG_02567 [Pseudogymnoascus destructans 20631-21]OAF56225.1 hypothetical protein VC83_07546 [Pseudogymnoascus destructans]
MDPFRNINNYMVNSRNQVAVTHLLKYMERTLLTNIEASLFDRLANLPCGPPFRESVFDRALGFLRAQYDEERDAAWAIALNPWECRLLNRTTGASFTKVFCTNLYIPFDGCYENKRDVGRLDNFLTNFGGLAARAASGHAVRGAINPWHIKELVFCQDPLFSSTDIGSVRDLSRARSINHFLKRLREDREGGLLPTVTPKRIKAYAEICTEGHLQEMEAMFGYDPNKVCLMWLRIIELLKYLPNLEVFKWQSDARVVEPFLSAISHYCKKLTVLEIELHNGFDNNEYMINAWNRFYLSKTTGRLYQSHRILNEPVAKHICQYISRDPKDRESEELPTQCHINLKLILKMDRDVQPIIETVGKYTRHVQSLYVDRSKSHEFMDDNKKREHGRPYERSWFHLQYGVTHLSLIGTDATMHNCIMGAIFPASIESLEIKDCQSLDGVYLPILSGPNRLRKFKISFPPPDEAKERAYRYWRHYVFQKQLTLDFLRCDTIELDELDIRGDFGDPSLNPVEFSGLSTDLFFAVEAQAKSLVSLKVLNNNIDFTLAEIGSIIVQAENLTQLGLSCRAFRYQDQFWHWIEQGLGTHRNFERLLALLGQNENPFSLTILRTHYHILDLANYERDGADRLIVPTRSVIDYEVIAKKMVEQGLPLAHLGIFAEGEKHGYGIYGAQWDEFLYAFELLDAELHLQNVLEGTVAMYSEFEKINRRWIEDCGVAMPIPVQDPPNREREI